MKGKIITESDEKKFKPFKVELEIDSVEEARLLFHVLNCKEIGDIVASSDYIEKSEYTGTISKYFSEDSIKYSLIYLKIAYYITKQGYEL